MKTVTNHLQTFLLACLLTLAIGQPAQAAIIYVKSGASGTGTSWANAFGDLQAALAAANSGDQIWVAAGTYKPTTGTNRYISFTMKNGVAIYGGFPNMGNPGFNHRNPDPGSNGTVLSGEIGATGIGDNSLHVISNSFSAGNPLTSTAVLDGFTVTGGYANDNYNPHANGGGMYNSFASPTVTNCKFSGNIANRLGGAVYNLGNGGTSSPSFSNCTFSGNSVTSFSSGGGAMYNEGKNGGVASPSITDCTFSGNTANNSAGAVLNYGNGGISSPSFSNCSFSSNSTTAYGGAIYNQGYSSGTASPSFTNCIFSGNIAKSTTNSGSFGGAVYNWGYIGGTASPSFSNCSFSGNSSESNGGAITNYGNYNGGTSSPSFTNCSFSNNSSNFGGALFNYGYTNGTSSPSFTNCTFFSNSANTHGGAMYNYAYLSSTAILNFTNCTFANNSAYYGGAMSNDSYNSTFTANMVNCILWGNTASNGPVFYYHNSATLSISYSMVQGGSCAALGGGTSCGAGMKFNQNPLFFNQANGDLQLQYCSPAIDVGNDSANNEPFDLNGDNRKFDAIPGGTKIDMGAFERQPPLLPIAKCKSAPIAQLGSNGIVTVYPADIDNGSSGCGSLILKINGQSSITYTCAQEGITQTVSLTVQDIYGSDNCTTSVTVEDNMAPNAICPNIPDVVLDANGKGSLPANIGNGSSTDNCSVTETSPAASFNCTDVGVQTVTLTASDVTQSTTVNCSFNVVDNTAPAANCPASIADVVLDANGTGTLPANIGDGSSTDNCSVTETSPAASFTCNDLGMHTVTLTATDGTNSSTVNCSFNVVDGTSPVVNCPASIPDVVLDANGNGTLPANIGDGSSTDNCGTPTETSPTASFTCANIGQQAVLLTATDGSGNFASVSCTFTVVDNILPTANCQPHTVQLGANGNGSLTANDIDGGSSDACGIASLSASPNVFACANIGANTVTLTVTDNNGNMKTCPATVTVEDNTPPTANCQPATYTLGASGVHTLDPADLFAGGSDNCGTVTPVSASPASLGCAQIGTNPVTLTVNDGSGNPATCTATVTILAGPYFTWYKDTDGDGYSDGAVTEGCTAPGNYVLAAGLTALDGDCNDSNPFVHPGRFEQCNGLDDDCDGTTDENAVTGISVDNISPCENGLFTADVTVTFDDIAPNGNLSLSGDGSASVAVGLLGGASHTFFSVEMAADGTAISLTAGFSASGCAFADTNAGTAPPNCAGCEITGISVANLGNCDPNENTDPTDDTFTADVTVHFTSPPASGTLDLYGDGSASVPTSSLTGNSHTFTGVTFAADGGAIGLSASFSDGDCGLDVTNAGTAFPPCCFVEITGAAATPESCTGFADGSLTVSANGTGTLAYSVDGGATFQLTNTFTNLVPGSYPVVVRVQGSGCEATSTAEVGAGTGGTTWYKDIDGDGYTDGLTLTQCTQPTGYVASAEPGDCNDYDADEFPGQTWYADLDGDGYTDGGMLTSCSQPMGHVVSALPGDCDDENPAVNPGAVEICDGIDNNCDGEVDEGASGGLTYAGNVWFTTQAQVDAFSSCYTIIDGSLTIQNSGVYDLSNLINLTGVTGNVYIKSTGLASMSGLDNLATIGGYLKVRTNDVLSTLDGLGGVLSVGGYLKVYYNENLVDCCAIHPLLGTPGAIAGSTTILRNETGCDSEEEVGTACGGGSNLIAPPACADCGIIAAEGMALGFDLYPNPASSELNIRLHQAPEQGGSVTLYDLMGRVVEAQDLAVGQTGATFDVSKKTPGEYLVRVATEHTPVMKRVMVVR